MVPLKPWPTAGAMMQRRGIKRFIVYGLLFVVAAAL
jgi:hypothetical protein